MIKNQKDLWPAILWSGIALCSALLIACWWKGLR